YRVYRLAFCFMNECAIFVRTDVKLGLCLAFHGLMQGAHFLIIPWREQSLNLIFVNLLR
ncbi:hypothetical protein ACJX0J_040794, partial [Zea mays]